MVNCLGFKDIWKVVKSSFTDGTSKQQKLDAIIDLYRQQTPEGSIILDDVAEAIATEIHKGLMKKLILPEGITIENIKEKILQKDKPLELESEVNTSNLVDPIKLSSTALANELDKVFGVYDVKSDVLNEFLKEFTLTIIWNPDTGKTPKNVEEMNLFILDLQQSLYDKVVDYMASNNKKIPNNFYNSDGTSNFHNIYLFMENVLENTSPYAIKRLKKEIAQGSNRLKLEAIKSYFLLKYFDALVFDNYRKTFKLSSPSFSGKFTTDTNKYIYGEDVYLATDWFNADTKSPKDIMSKRVQSIFLLIPYIEYGEDSGKKLNSGEVFYAIRELKNKLYNKGSQILVKYNGVLQDFNFTKQEKRFLNRVFKDKVDVNLELLFAATRNNVIDGYSALFKVLTESNLKNLELTPQANNNIISLQRYVFGETSNSLKNSDLDLYQELVHTLDYTSSIITSRYSSNEYDLWEIRLMSPLNKNAVEGQLKESINSIYDPISVEVLTNKYKIEKHFDEENPSKSYIYFEINNPKANKHSYIVQVNTEKADVQIRRKSDNRSLNEFDKTDYDSLQDFIRDTLGINLKTDLSLREELFRSVGRVQDKFKAVLQNIVPLAAVTLSTGKLMRSLLDSGLQPSKKEYLDIGIDWGLIKFLDNKKPAIRYNSSYEGYDVIHSKYLDLIKEIAQCKAMADRAYSKSVMPTAEGTKIPVDKLAHLNADRRTAIVTLVETKNSALRLSPDEALVEEYLTDGIAGWSTSREVKYSSGGKLTVSLNFNESLFSSFCLDFLTGFSEDGLRYYLFTEATVSDKPNTPKIFIKGKEVNLKIETLKLNLKRELGIVTFNVWKNIKKDFNDLQNFINQTNVEGRPIKYKGVELDSSLKLDYYNNFRDFNQWVKNHSTDLNKLDAGFLLNKICLEFNKIRRLHPIEITENVHKRNGKNGIELNKGFISELMRYNRDANLNLRQELLELNSLSDLWRSESKNDYWWNLLNIENYLRKNDLRLVDDLISNRANINVFHDSGIVKGLTWAKRLDEVGDHKWRKNNGDVIFAKIILNNKKVINVSNSFDLVGLHDGNNKSSDLAEFNFETLEKNETNNIKEIIVHPLLRKWNLADYYYTSKSTMGTVGAVWWCDSKKAKNTDYEIESAINDFQKRNVTQTATVNLYALGTLKGIAEQANFAIFKQPSTIVNNILGDSGEIDYWDGGTYTGAFLNHWEDASLSYLVTGDTKKPIMHFYNEKFALGQLNKTAAFAITNKIMRRSIFHQRLHYKSSKNTWLTKDGRSFDADITKDYRNNSIDYSDCYYELNGNYYLIANIEKVSKNRNGDDVTNYYKIEVTPVDVYGKKLQGEKNVVLYRLINSNYSFWNALGGMNSGQIVDGKFKKTEKSIEKVANVACIVGEALVPSEEITSLAGIYLFMKHSDIHYIVTDGAFKKAPGNLNPFEALTNNTDDLNFVRLRMNYSGIQLDPTHQADNAEVSLMTLVISALADRGYTREAANLVYSALAEIAEENLQPFYDAYSYFLNVNSKDEIINLITNNILESFKGSKVNSDNLLETISRNLFNLVQSRGKNKIRSTDLEGVIPWSENSVYSLINSTVTSTINKLAIRIKTFGSLSVLNPSHGTIELYGDRQLNEYTSAIDFYNSGIKLLDNKIMDHSFRMNRYYRYTDEFGQQHNIQLSLENYYDFIKNVDKGNYTDISETFLGNETVLLENGKTYNGFLFDTPYFGLIRYYKTEQDAIEGNAIYKFQQGNINRFYGDANNNPVLYYKIEAILLLGRDLDTYNVFLNRGLYNIFDLKSVHDKVVLHLNRKTTLNFNEKLHELNRKILDDFLKIYNKLEVEIYKDGEIIRADVSSHLTHSYGILLPMIYKSKLGLREGDNVSDIVNDPEFFFKRILQDLYELDTISKKVLDENYDIILRRTDGNNIYLKLKDGSPIDSKKLSVIDVRKSFDYNGLLWRETNDREAIYKLSSESDVIYKDNSINNGGEIIFTDAEGLKFYIDLFRHDIFDILVKNPKAGKGRTPEFYEEFNASKEKYHKNLENIIKNTKYAKNIKNFSIKSLVFDWSDNIINYAFRGQSLELSGLLKLLERNSKNYKLKDLYLLARRRHTAFLKSLNVLAARIPSQGMASFMTMKVEGFTDGDVNNCFISDMQIWLQGSDFDVDKVTLMGSSFSNAGRYIKWSRYMFDDTLDALNITSDLNLPTGKKVDVVDNEEVNLDIYEDLFDNKGKLNLKDSLNSPGITAFASEPYNLDKLRKFVKMINRFNRVLEGPKDSKIRGWILLVVDNHNLTRFPEKIKDLALSNLIQHVATNISKDIRNAVASLLSTDEVSKPLEALAESSSFGTKDYQNRYGNAAVKIKQVISNQTGKSGVAITASVGIKAFFAITLYMNTKLALAKTPQEAAKYYFDVKVDDLNYHTIANINIDADILRDWQNSDNVHLRDMASSIIKNNKVDADTTISGIMTLAVDNAKKLLLAKLNASSAILGLYIYGVSIGVPFENLMKIFTSNIADVLNQNINGNVFEGNDDVRLGQAIAKLKYGPYLSAKTLENKTSYINTLKILLIDNSTYKSMADMIIGENGIINLAVSKFKEGTPNYLFNRRFYIVEKLRNIKDKLDLLYVRTDNEYDKRFVNESYTYLDLIYRIYGNGLIERANKTLADIETLYEGKKELSTLKNLILNQGVRVLENEQLTWLNTFGNVIKQRLGNNETTSEVRYFKELNNDSLLIDILKYTFDPEYKQAAINAYGSIKHTINVLEVIDTLPHFSLYLKGYGASNIAKLLSSKYEAKSKLIDSLFNIYKIRENGDKIKMLKRLDDFLTNVIYNEFLKSDDVPEVMIKAGSSIINEYGKTEVLKEDTPIRLGYDLGNTNFKLWVENVVVPDLLSMPTYYENSFINDLVSRRYKNTLFGNLIRGLTLPVDMIPRSDSDIQRLSKYKFDFSELTDTYRSSGLTILEIFFLYSMITYQGKHNIRSLAPVTELLYTLKGSIADKVKTFISNFDKNSELVFDDVTQYEISNYFTKDELILAVAPSVREVNYKKFEGPYLHMFNYKTLLWELLERIPLETEKTLLIRQRPLGDEELEENFGDNELLAEMYDIEQLLRKEFGDDDVYDENYDEQGEDVTESLLYQKKYTDIYTLFRTVATFGGIGAESAISKTLGKLPQIDSSQLITADTKYQKLNDYTIIDVKSENDIIQSVEVSYNKDGNKFNFNVDPLISIKRIDNKSTQVVNRLDLAVKINKKLRELLKIKC